MHSIHRHLSEDEAQLLGCCCDCIIPEDEFPGATSAGVLHFISGLFEQFPSLVSQYRAGLDLVSAASDGHFCAMDNESKDQILRGFEDHPFFDLLITHVLEGYYSDPENGGNKDGLSWQMIGFVVTA